MHFYIYIILRRSQSWRSTDLNVGPELIIPALLSYLVCNLCSSSVKLLQINLWSLNLSIIKITAPSRCGFIVVLSGVSHVRQSLRQYMLLCDILCHVTTPTCWEDCTYMRQSMWRRQGHIHTYTIVHPTNESNVSRDNCGKALHAHEQIN